MIRLATIIVWLNMTRFLLWNVGSPAEREWMLKAGSLVSFDSGVHGALTRDDEGLRWCACWVDRQQSWDEYEVWAGMLTGECDHSRGRQSRSLIAYRCKALSACMIRKKIANRF
jgi:hypothetical protein